MNCKLFMPYTFQRTKPMAYVSNIVKACNFTGAFMLDHYLSAVSHVSIGNARAVICPFSFTIKTVCQPPRRFVRPPPVRISGWRPKGPVSTRVVGLKAAS